MLENKPINVFEDGLESRDFVNVVDVAAGVISALNNAESNGEIINLGSGVGTSVKEITQILKERIRVKAQSILLVISDLVTLHTMLQI